MSDKRTPKSGSGRLSLGSRQAEQGAMAFWRRTAVLAAGLLGTLAVGLAEAAAIYDRVPDPPAAKGDRLPQLAEPDGEYVTVGTHGKGITVLSRVRAHQPDNEDRAEEARR